MASNTQTHHLIHSGHNELMLQRKEALCTQETRNTTKKKRGCNLYKHKEPPAIWWWTSVHKTHNVCCYQSLNIKTENLKAGLSVTEKKKSQSDSVKETKTYLIFNVKKCKPFQRDVSHEKWNLKVHHLSLKYKFSVCSDSILTQCVYSRSIGVLIICSVNII